MVSILLPLGYQLFDFVLSSPMATNKKDYLKDTLKTFDDCKNKQKSV